MRSLTCFPWPLYPNTCEAPRTPAAVPLSVVTYTVPSGATAMPPGTPGSGTRANKPGDLVDAPRDRGVAGAATTAVVITWLRGTGAVSGAAATGAPDRECASRAEKGCSAEPADPCSS